MKRPYIPVRDGILPQAKIRPKWLPEAGFNEYRAGFWFGYIAGLCWGTLLTVIVLRVLL